MALRITANTLLERRYILIKRNMVHVPKQSFLGGAHHFSFSEIESVILSANSVLSFQVGKEVFSIPINPGKRKHRAVLDALLEGVRSTVARPQQPAGSPPPIQPPVE